MIQPRDDVSNDDCDSTNGSPIQKCSSDESITPESFTNEDFEEKTKIQEEEAPGCSRVLTESQTDPKEVIDQPEPTTTNRQQHHPHVESGAASPPLLQTAVVWTSSSLSQDLTKIAKVEAGKLVNQTFDIVDDMNGPKKFITLEYCKQADSQSASSAINRGEVPQEKLFTVEEFFAEAESVAEEKSKIHTTDEARRNSRNLIKNSVWLVGAAGSGKTCSSKIFLSYAIAQDDIKYIFSFQCGSLDLEKPRTISRFLLDESRIDEKFLTELKGLDDRDDVLLVFDALDEIDVKRLKRESSMETGYTHLSNLLSGEVFPRAKKLWTANIHALNTIRKKFTIETVFQVLPLSSEIHKKFSRSFAPSSSDDSAQEVLESHPEVRQLCQMPFFAVILHSTAIKDLAHYSISNFLCMGLQCNIKKLKDKMDKKSLLDDKLPQLCKAAWKSFVEGKPVIDEGLEDLGARVKGRFLDPQVKQGIQQRYKFQHRFRQCLLASIHAVTTLDDKVFMREVSSETMASSRWEMMSSCLFGMCDVTKRYICKFIRRRIKQGEKILVSEKKLEHLMRIAEAMAREAKFANGYDERIQALFRVGRWMREANRDDMMTRVAEHLPNKVQLADKIFPADVRALSHLARSHDMTLSLGIMSSPRFQDDAALLIFKEIADVNDLKMSSVDLRGNKISEEVAEEMAKCVGKFDSLNLASTGTDESVLSSVVEAIGKLPRKKHRLKLVLGDSNLRMSERLTAEISCAVPNLRELVLVAEYIPHSGLLAVVRTIGKMPVKLDLLDLGIPMLDDEIAENLGECLANIRCLHLRGCKVTGNSVGLLARALNELPHEMRGFFLDHVTVTDDDVEALSRCLPKFKVWLVIMYCDVTRQGYRLLKAEHDALPSNNCLQIFLGDVTDVGESVTIRK